MANITGNITRVEIEDFGKVNRALPSSKIADNEFYTKENIVNRSTKFRSLAKRYGIQRYNTNQLDATGTIINLFEARLNDGYYLIGKDSDGAGTSNLKYTGTANTYTSAWTSISTTEYAGHYYFEQLKNKIYICNRVDNSNNLLTNKVWDKTSGVYADMGCNPYATDSYSAVGMTTSGAELSTDKYYYYVVTWLYDGYQESSCLWYVEAETTGTENSVQLSNISNSATSSRITHIKIYRSIGLAETSLPEDLYYLVTLPIASGGADTNYLDTKADAYLGSAIPIETFFKQKRPYKNKYFTVHNNRLIAGNLEIESKRYSAITDTDMGYSASTGAGALTLLSVYKYRFYKCYLSPSGGQFGFIVGSKLEETVSALTGTQNTITITLSNYATHFDNWCNHILIERTIGGGSEFKYHSVQSIGTMVSGYADIISDASLLIKHNIPKSMIQGNEISETKFKDLISISDINSGDLFDAINIKDTDSESNQGITGIFSESSRIVVFKPNNIFAIDTKAQSTEFWDSYKVVTGIGASGQDTYPKTETVGHNGIQQLPNDNGYIFFSNAYAGSSSVLTKIYYWSGSGEPEIISNEIESYISAVSNLSVKGMCYDHINNWVWAVVVTASTTRLILIYDLNFKEWYVFRFNNVIILNNVVCTEDGRIIFGAEVGYINNYSTGTFVETYSGSTYTFTMGIQTKNFEPYNADINASQIEILIETASATTTSNNVVYALDNTETPETIATSSATMHRIKKRFNATGKRIYFRYENTENKDIIIHKLAFDLRPLHIRAGGKL